MDPKACHRNRVQLGVSQVLKAPFGNSSNGKGDTAGVNASVYVIFASRVASLSARRCPRPRPSADPGGSTPDDALERHPRTDGLLTHQALDDVPGRGVFLLTRIGDRIDADETRLIQRTQRRSDAASVCACVLLDPVVR